MPRPVSISLAGVVRRPSCRPLATFTRALARVALAAGALALASSRALAHHDEDALAPGPLPAPPAAAPEPAAAGAPVKPDPSLRSGQGDWVFRYDAELSALPEKAGKHLRGAHGGFAVDWRGERDVYFALKGCGIVHLSPDLARKRIIEVDPFVREGNFHNTTLIYDSAGKASLALPDNERERVYILSTDGKLQKVLSHPRGNPYYDGWGGFVPTDVEQAPGGDIFVVTGYSRGDYVVTADPFAGKWKPLIFGGKGTEHGKFGTGHGITWNPRTETLDISDRPHSRVESFDTRGVYRATLTLPAGCLPCDVDFYGDHTVVGCLKGPGGKTPAPAYIVDSSGKVVSTVNPKADLGLDLFTHIHNATWHAVGEGAGARIFLLVLAWNPGGFAVLERVK